MSLVEAFAYNDAEGFSVEPEHDAIARYVREKYLGRDGKENAHHKRRKHMEERLRWYRDDYERDVLKLIDLIFDNPKVRSQRAKFAELAMGINVTKRIIDEISSLYDRPAERIFLDDEQRQGRFDQLAHDLELDDTAAEAHKLLNLCNDLILWSPDVDGRPRRLDVITPDAFDAIPDPRQPLTLAGLIIDTTPQTLNTGAHRDKLPHYEVWDDEFVMQLDADGRLIKTHEHKLGRIPGILIHRKKPTSELLDASGGRDILGAHKAVCFLNLCILRLSKAQGENQPILRGMLASVAQGQAMDGETPIALPPEVTLEMLQSKTDPEHYLKVIKHYVAGVAQTYGMSYEQFTFQETADTASGKAYQVRRQKLSEIRNEQAKRWRRIEPDVVRLLGFDTGGFHVDFHDPSIPQDPSEELQLLRDKMRLGLDNPVAFMMRKDPDLTAKTAWRIFDANTRLNAKIWSILRALNMPGDADAENPGQTPQQNGAMGGPRPQRDLNDLARRVLNAAA